MIQTERKDGMRRISWAIFFVILGCLLTTGIVNAQSTDKENAAIKSAEKWLGLVDDGKYAESWTEAAGYFKNSITQEKWDQTLNAVRNPLGKLISREVKSKTYTTSVPGAPDGEYVVIQFDTSFQNKKSAIETVTPMLDKDGKWRVSGYYINAQPTEKEKAAIESAEKWLGLVDAGKYAEGWMEGAAYFKNAVTQEKLVESLKAVREPLGKVISRRVNSTTYATSLPGAPDGEYVVIQFETSFANKGAAVETVTPILDKDGQWKVDGYYIK
jgi:hypothetical protein